MPEQEGWLSFVKSCIRKFSVFVQCHLAVGAWIQFAKFEVKNGGHVVRARERY